ncbi:hypothetical protein TNCV_2488771 [Trichonephila clavipes]|nr:hypothetical protein TNCV_2488771 [Trichonephila clavipes]
MSRFGGLSEERPSVFKTRSKIGTHLSTQCSGDERGRVDLAHPVNRTPDLWLVHIVSGLLCMSKVSLKAECAVWVPPNKVNTMPKGEITNAISYRNRFLKANLVATVNENPYTGIKRKA